MKKLLYSVIMTLAALSLLITAVFAWFIIMEKTEPIIISTGSLNTSCALYYGVDANFDGILDDDECVEITEEGIVFSDVIPGQIYTYKMVVKNLGSVDGMLSVEASGIIASHDDMYAGFSILFSDPEEKNIRMAAGALLLFSGHVLETKETYEFYFAITVGDSIYSDLKDERLTVTNFVVNLTQIPPE